MKSIFILSLFLSSAAWAVPLFGETAGTIKDGVLTLYKDDQDAKKVYFFPNSTQFSVDAAKVPLFNYVYWNNGAYMSLTTHLASDDSQQSALNNYMKNHPDMEVAVLPIRSSMIGLQTTATNQQPLSLLFSEFNFARVGGRAEDEIGVNAVLTPIGAHAFTALFKKTQGGSPLKFDYCYTIQGFGPNMNATVSVDMKRVYDYFQASHSGGWGWFSWSIQAVVEKLKDERAIQITMNGGDAKEWEVLNTVADTITTRLFQPELSASPISMASENRLFNFGVNSVHKEELKTEVWNFVRRDLEEREFCTAIDVKDLDGYMNKLVVSTDP